MNDILIAKRATIDDGEAALDEFRRVMRRIVVIAVLMVVGALSYLELFATLSPTLVIATVLGVFVTVLPGGGALAVFSIRSAFDRSAHPDRDGLQRQNSGPETMS